MNVRALLRPVRRLWPQKVRTRLTLIYAMLFFAAGSALLGLTYGLVASSLPARPPAAATISTQELNTLIHECKPAGSALKGKHLVPAPPPFMPACKQAKAAYYAGTAAGSEAQRQSALSKLLSVSLVGLAVMTVASGGLGWVMSGRVLRPVRVITETARRASEQHLGERLALTGARDELKELADTFDGMLERLDAAFATQRRFVANASHELRTPLTVMRTAIDVTLAKPSPTARQLTDMAVRVRRSIDRAENMVEALPFVPDAGVPSLFEPFGRMQAPDRSPRRRRARPVHRPVGRHRAPRDRHRPQPARRRPRHLSRDPTLPRCGTAPPSRPAALTGGRRGASGHPPRLP